MFLLTNLCLSLSGSLLLTRRFVILILFHVTLLFVDFECSFNTISHGLALCLLLASRLMPKALLFSCKCTL